MACQISTAQFHATPTTSSNKTATSPTFITIKNTILDNIQMFVFDLRLRTMKAVASLDPNSQVCAPNLCLPKIVGPEPYDKIKHVAPNHTKAFGPSMVSPYEGLWALNGLPKQGRWALNNPPTRMPLGTQRASPSERPDC